MKKIVATNKKANFNYFIENTMESGICLLGSEVKSLRLGNVSIRESYVKVVENELFLCNCHIGSYEKSNKFSHDALRPRKLLCHKKEIDRLVGKSKMQGYSIVPVSVYFNSKGIAKVDIGIGKGKKLFDKRQDLKTKEWNKVKSRLARRKI